MALTTNPEVELFVSSMNVDALDKGSYIQNMQHFENSLELRKGFGTLWQFDSTLVYDNFTIDNHLGSALIKTDFGHEQILSVFKVTTFTGNLYGGALGQDTGIYGSFYLVTIYDTTTDTYWEEMLYRKSSEYLSSNLEQQHGLYETNRTNKYENYITALDKEFFFEELNDVLYFGSKAAGVYAYIPATFRDNRRKHVDGVHKNDWALGYSETSLIEKISPADGAFSDAFKYLNSSEFPSPADICSIGGRMAYAIDREIFFSDPNKPNSIIAGNNVFIPTENKITCIEELNGNLMVFTNTETFLYQPSSGILMSAGRISKVSDNTGCLSANSIGRIDGALAWVSSSGIWVTSTGLDTKELSKGIRKFWSEFISNPLTQFYQQNGYTNLSKTQPSIELRYGASPGKVSVAYDKVRRNLIFVIPEQNIALVWNEGWIIWNWTSTAAVQNTVEATSKIANPWLVSGEIELYLIGSKETVPLRDAQASSLVPKENRDLDSFYILQYMRGGSLDKSIGDPTEDARNISGKYYNLRDTTSGPTSGSLAFIFDEPIKLETGFQFSFSGSLQQAAVITYLLPISIVLNDVGGLNYANSLKSSLPNRIDLDFRFDSTNWTPIFTASNAAEINFILPPERLSSGPGYATGSMRSGSAEVRCYNPGNGLPSQAGNEIRIHWSGSGTKTSTAPGYADRGQQPYTGPYGDVMNLSSNAKNPLIYIPMKYAGASADNVMNMGIYPIHGRIMSASSTGGGVITFDKKCDMFVFQKAQWNSSSLAEDERAQGIDWVWKSNQVGVKGQNQLKARTVFSKVKSNGSADTQTVSNGSIFGLYNSLISADHKDWSAQIVDYASGSLTGSIQEVVNKSTLYARMKSDGNLTNVVYNLSASWGRITSQGTGSYLIDDAEYDTIAISDSVRGEHFSVMLFGNTRNRAENIAVDSIKIDFRVISGRRRYGR